MADQKPEPERKYLPVPLGGILDQSVTPARVGPGGLTACQNLIYRRFGAWGKRPGSTVVYSAFVPPAPPTPPKPPPSYTPAPKIPPHPAPPPPGPHGFRPLE